MSEGRFAQETSCFGEMGVAINDIIPWPRFRDSRYNYDNNIVAESCGVLLEFTSEAEKGGFPIIPKQQ